MQIPFWQELGIDPILLGQPKLWIYPSDTNYLVNTLGVAPTNGNILNLFNRFNDAAFNPTQASTTNRAIYSVLAGQPHPYGYVRWAGGTLTANGYYRVGTTSDFSFMHKLNEGCTVYWINKNDSTENTGTTKVIAANIVSSSSIGAILAIENTSSTLRKRALTVYNGNIGAPTFSLTESSTYTRTNDYPVRLDSIRYDLSKSVGQDCAWWYVNGILDSTVTMQNAPSASATSSFVMNVGNRNSSGLRNCGNMGDFIIFNAVHDEATHLKVCNFLKRKWRIS